MGKSPQLAVVFHNSEGTDFITDWKFNCSSPPHLCLVTRWLWFSTTVKAQTSSLIGNLIVLHLLTFVWLPGGQSVSTIDYRRSSWELKPYFGMPSKLSLISCKCTNLAQLLFVLLNLNCGVNKPALKNLTAFIR